MTEEPAPVGGELLAAAEEIIAVAATAGTTLRLLGGIAVFHLAPSARRPPLARAYHDYDVVVSSRQGGSAGGCSAPPATPRTLTSTRCTARSA